MEAFKDFAFKPGDVVCLKCDEEGAIRLVVTARCLWDGGERAYRCAGHVSGSGTEGRIPHARNDYSECELMPAPPSMSSLREAKQAMLDAMRDANERRAKAKGEGV